MPKKTKIGYQYDFNSIKGYAEFKERVPIKSYEEIADDIYKSREGEDNYFGQPRSNGMQSQVVQLILEVNLFL